MAASRIDIKLWALTILALSGSFFAWGETVFADNRAKQIVQYQVASINEIAVSGDPEGLTVRVNDTTTDGFTIYAITTNMDNRKITGALNAEMPSGVMLEVRLTAPPGASSSGFQPLQDSAQDLVTGISRKASAGLSIQYRITALSGVKMQTGQRMVTLTLTQ